MNLTGNAVFITGGASGIGRDLERLSVLVNNAGVQRNYAFAEDPEAPDRIDEENAPLYRAAKAALRFFTRVSCYRLESTPVALFEVAPALLAPMMRRA